MRTTYRHRYAIVALSIMAVITLPASIMPMKDISFRKIILTKDFISEGVAIGDVNHDGKMDIMAGAFWFEAPDWKKHEIATPYKFNPDTSYSNAFLCYSMDVNKDGWIDLVRIGTPGSAAYWLENNQNRAGHWKSHLIQKNVGNESASMHDINGDGQPDLLCSDPINKRVVWAEAPANNYEAVWKQHIISSKPDLATHQYTHGLGYADVNGDGSKDVIVKDGWWEQPSDHSSEWLFYKAPLGDDCAQMFAVDVDQDGDNDILSSSAHDYGIWWHEQVKEGNNITWKKHTISQLFSQSHGLALADVNNDGHPDLVTGKRYYAHNGKDPGAHDPAVLYWFEFVPGKVPQWQPHLVDSNAGAGLSFVVSDIDGDGLTDIVVSNKKGAHLFLQQRSK